MTLDRSIKHEPLEEGLYMRVFFENGIPSLHNLLTLLIPTGFTASDQ